MITKEKVKKIVVRNPWTGEILDEIPNSNNDEIADKLRGMRRSSKNQSIPIKDRIEMAKEFGRYLEGSKEEYSNLVAMETGMPISHVEARLKIAYEKWKGVEDYLRNVFGDDYDKILSGEWVPKRGSKEGSHYVRRNPKGTYLFLPANTDPMGTIHHLLDFVLADNRIVVKPGTRAPLSTIKAVNDMKRFGFENYITYVIGSGEEILDMALTSDYLDGIFFIGRSEHGRKIQSKCAEKGIHYMGDYEGNNYMFILEDTAKDYEALSKACSDLVMLSTFFNGLACTAIKACSPENNYEEFEKLLLEEAEIVNNSIGNPTDRRTLLGPLISPKLVDECMYSVKEAAEKGADIIIGGKPIQNPNTGEYNIMPYTVLRNVKDDSYILYTETPGPVIWIEKDFGLMLERGKKNEERNRDERLGRNGLRYIVSTNDIERMKEFGKSYRTAFIKRRATDVDPIWMWGGSGKTSTFNGAEFLINECMDTQTLYITDNFLAELEGFNNYMTIARETAKQSKIK